MICAGMKLTIRPNKRYPNNPEKNEDIQVGEDRFGQYQQGQVMDRNVGEGGNVKTGFFYCRVYTDIPIQPNDVVTVKQILAVKRNGNIATVYVSIEETTPAYYETKIDEDETFGF